MRGHGLILALIHSSSSLMAKKTIFVTSLLYFFLESIKFVCCVSVVSDSFNLEFKFILVAIAYLVIWSFVKKEIFEFVVTLRYVLILVVR